LTTSKHDAEGPTRQKGEKGGQNVVSVAGVNREIQERGNRDDVEGGKKGGAAEGSPEREQG